MYRLVLILLLFFVIFRIGKSIWQDLKKVKASRYRSQPPPSLPVKDKLVKDPVCGIYCPKKTALKAHYQGKTYYFCSEKCRQKFLSQKAASV